jgi:hypothetical protein
MVKAAGSFKKLQEILSDAKKKHGKTLVADVIDVVTRFCEDDEISKYPNQHVQKQTHLVLAN